MQTKSDSGFTGDLGFQNLRLENAVLPLYCHFLLPTYLALSRKMAILFHMDDDELQALETGRIHWFSDWPTGDVPRSGAIVYTVWDRKERFIYVGYSGRKGASPTGKGPFGRLSNHANGYRSGDKFCMARRMAVEPSGVEQ